MFAKTWIVGKEIARLLLIPLSSLNVYVILVGSSLFLALKITSNFSLVLFPIVRANLSLSLLALIE